jgi:glycosyltransferase involved in cell wall biosynthesis
VVKQSEDNFKINISVIIPTFNRACLVTRSIDSVMRQSYLPQELIVVDDGSEDDTKVVIQEKFASVRYIKQANKGPASARNVGIENAENKWLAFLDSDDLWMPNKLEKQVKALENNPGMQFCYSDEIWIRDGARVNQKKKHAKFGGDIYQQCLPLCIISPSSAMIHVDVFEEVGMFDASLPACEDYDMWLRITAKFPVLFLDEPLIKKYGGHEDQLSRKYWGMDRFRIQALEKMVNSGELEAEDQTATLRMLLRKIGILKTGAIKRKKNDDVAKLNKKESFYLASLNEHMKY